MILDRTPINEKISLSVRERKQVQNYLRRRARRVMKARPRVKTARSFALDSTLYTVGRTLVGQGLAISSLEKGKRIFIPLKGEGEISGNIRITLDPESRKVEAHVSSEVKVAVNDSEKVIAADVGLTEVFVDDEGNHYGKELGDTLKKASGRLNEKGKKRNKLHALAKKYDRQCKTAKSRNIRRRKPMPGMPAEKSDIKERFLGSTVKRRCGELGHAVDGRDIGLKTSDLPAWFLARTLLDGGRRFDKKQGSFSSQGNG